MDNRDQIDVVSLLAADTEPTDFLQGVCLEARNVSVCGTPALALRGGDGKLGVQRRSKLILDDVSFTVMPGTLSAIVGPNGAGKTTLMRALSGKRPAAGQVLIDGQNLYDEPEYWLRNIGYVPVESILHEQLTLFDALMYTGRLRLTEKDLHQIEARIDELLTDFGFPSGDDRRYQQIRTLSSGERKRANVCSELIIDPPILLLDEPTSNLDPDAERNLMELLARYARENGQTILIITHTLSTIDLCQQVIFIENAQLQAVGGALEVLAELEGNSDSIDPAASLFYRWAAVFDYYKNDDATRKDCSRRLMSQRSARRPGEQRQISAAGWFVQLRCLLSRYMQVRLGDKGSLVGTLLAGFSGILFFILPGHTFMEPVDPSEVGVALNQARQSVYVVSIIVVLIGLITSYTEISKEFRIFQHERLKGLSVSAYFMSKWIWLTLAVGVLAPIVLVAFIVLVYGQPLPGFPEPRIGESVNWWDQLIRFQLVGLLTQQTSWLILITLILACITSVTLGLLISAVAGGSDRGYLYLSFVVVFIVLFSGLLRNPKLDRLVDSLAFLSTGRWAFEGFASSTSLYCWLDSWRFEEFNSAGHIVSIWLSLLAYTLIAALLAVAALRLRDPWYDRRSKLTRLFSKDRLKLLTFAAIIIVLLSNAMFLRQQSRQYHVLNYWSEQKYGGTSAYEYPNIGKVENPGILQYLNGRLSQSWCGDSS